MQPSKPEPTPVTPVVKRPWSVTLLTLGVLLITALNLTRFALSLREWTFLASQPGISPLYLAASGLIWAVAGSALVWGCGRRRDGRPG